MPTTQQDLQSGLEKSTALLSERATIQAALETARNAATTTGEELAAGLANLETAEADGAISGVDSGDLKAMRKRASGLRETASFTKSRISGLAKLLDGNTLALEAAKVELIRARSEQAEIELLDHRRRILASVEALRKVMAAALSTAAGFDASHVFALWFRDAYFPGTPGDRFSHNLLDCASGGLMPWQSDPTLLDAATPEHSEILRKINSVLALAGVA